MTTRSPRRLALAACLAMTAPAVVGGQAVAAPQHAPSAAVDATAAHRFTTGALTAAGVRTAAAPGSDLEGDGPHPVTSVSVSADMTPAEMGGADYIYPSDVPAEQQLPTVTMIPGFTDSRASVRWLAERLASHGLLVQLIDPVTPLDPPPARAKAVVAAQRYLLTDSPASHRADPDRLALWGYSMGGGGVLEAASQLPSVKAVVAVFPWDTHPSFPAITAPTMIVAGEDDGTAVKEWYAKPAYASLTVADRAYAELAQARHPLPSHSTDPRLSEASAAWLLSHLTGDADAHALLCPGPTPGTPVAGGPGYSAYTATCPQP